MTNYSVICHENGSLAQTQQRICVDPKGESLKDKPQKSEFFPTQSGKFWPFQSAFAPILRYRAPTAERMIGTPP